MLRSMYSGISGMKVNQTKLDVIGNNISNVNTTSFKSSRTNFSDVLSQNVSEAKGSSANQGGSNASQVGLGVQLASIDAVMTQGNIQTTGRQLDVAIDGDGFFMVSKGPEIYDGTLEVNHKVGAHIITEQSLNNSSSEIRYTRDGAFSLDDKGNLLTSDGYRVMGYSLTNDDSSKQATGLSPNTINTSGLNFKFGPGSQLNGYKVVLGAIGPGTVTSAEVNESEKQIILNGDFSVEGNLSQVEIESAINKGLSSAGISQQAYVTGKPVNFDDLQSETVTGGTDTSSPSSITFAGIDIDFEDGSELNGYKFQVGTISEGTNTSVNIDEESKIIFINGDFVNSNAIDTDDIEDALTEALEQSGINQEVNVSGNPIRISDAFSEVTNGGTPIASINENGSINFVDATSNIKSYDGELKTLKIPDTVLIAGTDTELRVTSYTIDESGIINGVLEDGRVAALGQIAMASFKNTEGLTKLGGNLYGSSVNSGEAIIKSGVGTLDDDNSSGYGDNLQGMLEMSNVDLAEQFTDMIVASRAFQAAGKMITTGDEILQDIINLKR